MDFTWLLCHLASDTQAWLLLCHLASDIQAWRRGFRTLPKWDKFHSKTSEDHQTATSENKRPPRTTSEDHINESVDTAKVWIPYTAPRTSKFWGSESVDTDDPKKCVYQSSQNKDQNGDLRGPNGDPRGPKQAFFTSRVNRLKKWHLEKTTLSATCKTFYNINIRPKFWKSSGYSCNNP